MSFMQSIRVKVTGKDKPSLRKLFIPVKEEEFDQEDDGQVDVTKDEGGEEGAAGAGRDGQAAAGAGRPAPGGQRVMTAGRRRPPRPRG